MTEAILANSDQQEFTWDSAGRMTVTEITAQAGLLGAVNNLTNLHTQIIAMQALLDPDNIGGYLVYLMMLDKGGHYLRQYRLSATGVLNLRGQKQYTDYYHSSGRKTFFSKNVKDFSLEDSGRVLHMVYMDSVLGLLDIYEYTSTSYGTNWVSENTYTVHSALSLNNDVIYWRFLPGYQAALLAKNRVRDVYTDWIVTLVKLTASDHTRLIAAPAVTRTIQIPRDVKGLMARQDCGQIIEIIDAIEDSESSEDFVRAYDVTGVDVGPNAGKLLGTDAWLRGNAVPTDASLANNDNYPTVISWTPDGQVALIAQNLTTGNRLYRAERNAGVSDLTLHLFGGGAAGAAAQGTGAARTSGGGGGSGHYVRRTVQVSTGDVLNIAVGTGGLVVDTTGGTSIVKGSGVDLSAAGGTRAVGAQGGDSASDIDGTAASYLGGAGSGVYAGGGAGSGGYGESAGSAASGAGGPGINLSALGLGTIGAGGRGGQNAPGTPQSAGGGDGQSTTGSAPSAGGDGLVVLVTPTLAYSAEHAGNPTVTQSGDQTVMRFDADGRYTVGLPAAPANVTQPPIRPYFISRLARTGTVINMPTAETGYSNLGGLVRTPASASGGRPGFMVVANSSASARRRFIYQFTTTSTSERGLREATYSKKSPGLFNDELSVSVMLGKGSEEIGSFDASQVKVRSYELLTANDISTLSRTGTTSNTLSAANEIPPTGYSYKMMFADTGESVLGREPSYILSTSARDTVLRQFFTDSQNTFTSFRSSSGQLFTDFTVSSKGNAKYASLSDDRRNLLILYDDNTVQAWQLTGPGNFNALTAYGSASLGTGNFSAVCWNGPNHVLIADQANSQIVEFSIV